MATVDELKTRLESLEEQRDSGVASISHGKRTITYRGMDEIDRAIAALKRRIASGEGRRPLRYLRVNSEKGL